MTEAPAESRSWHADEASVMVPSTAVVICDEQPLVRRGLRAVIEAEPSCAVVAEVADCDQVRELAGRASPVVVVMEAGWRGRDVRRLTTEFAGLGLGVGVILLVTDLRAEDVVALLRTGARGVLYKNDAPVELVRAVRMVAADGAYLSSKVTGLLADSLHREGGIPHLHGAADMAGLTERELQIFRLVAAGRTNPEIARGLFISEATVKSHFNRICKKLGIVNRVQAVILAHELGMIADWG